MQGFEIVVKSEKTRIERTRKGNELRKQQAAIVNGGDWPLPFELTVDEPYPPGRYTLGPGSFRVSQFQSLELDPYRMTLEPLAQK